MGFDWLAASTTTLLVTIGAREMADPISFLSFFSCLIPGAANSPYPFLFHTRLSSMITFDIPSSMLSFTQSHTLHYGGNRHYVPLLSITKPVELTSNIKKFEGFFFFQREMIPLSELLIFNGSSSLPSETLLLGARRPRTR